MNQTEENLKRIRAYNKRVCDEWDESKHPRAANGQFGSGGGKGLPSNHPDRPAKEKNIAKLREEYGRALKKHNAHFIRGNGDPSSEEGKKSFKNLAKLEKQIHEALVELDGPGAF